MHELGARTLSTAAHISTIETQLKVIGENVVELGKIVSENRAFERVAVVLTSQVICADVDAAQLALYAA